MAAGVGVGLTAGAACRFVGVTPPAYCWMHFPLSANQNSRGPLQRALHARCENQWPFGQIGMGELAYKGAQAALAASQYQSLGHCLL